MVVYGDEETGNIYGYRIQLPQEENEAGGISGNHGRDHSLDEWVGVIEPYYPKGKRGRPPMGIEKMLRMYLLQI